MFSRLMIFFLLMSSASAQVSPVTHIQRLIESEVGYRQLAEQKPGDRNPDAIKEMLTEGELAFGSLIRQKLELVRPAFSALAAPRKVKGDVFDSIFAKLTAPPTAGVGNSNASTSAVSGGGLPLVLGLAMERGAITQSTSGTVLTLSGNGLGVARAIGGTDTYCLALECGRQADVLRKISFSVGLDMSRGSSINATGNSPDNGAKEQLDHVRVRLDLVNQRDIRGKHFQKDWDKTMTDEGLRDAASALSETANALFQPVVADYVSIRADLEKALLQAPDAEAMAILIDSAVSRASLIVLASEGAKSKMAAYQKADATYRLKIDEAARKAVTKFAHAIEYSYLRPKNQPELSNIRYVGAGNVGGSEQWRFSANAALEFYNSPPANSAVGAWRDLQLSAQLERFFFEKEKMNVTLTGAAYYQWMKERAVINIEAGELAPGTNIPLPGSAPTLLAPEGSIGLGQVKLTFGVRDTKIKIPISFIFANRTELIKATEVRGQIGISYDFDSLFKK